LETLDKRLVGHLLWSPRGRFIVIFSNNGNFEFYDAESSETMAKDKQHLMATFVTWDPTGRYVTTYVSAWKAKTEHGYKIWSFRGIELYSILQEGFLQFAWRPRPPTLLSEETLKKLEDPSFFKKYRDKYKEEDKTKVGERNAALMKDREKLRRQYRLYMAQKKLEYEEDALFRKKLGIEEDEGYMVEEMVEELMDVKEKIEDEKKKDRTNFHQVTN